MIVRLILKPQMSGRLTQINADKFQEGRSNESNLVYFLVDESKGWFLAALKVEIKWSYYLY